MSNPGFQSYSSTNLASNLENSIKDFLSQYVVTPYNAAVTGTNYATQIGIKIVNPDDPEVISQVPTILLDFPIDTRSPVSTGAGDGTVTKYKEFWIRVYPGLSTDSTTGAQKPSIQSAQILQSLFEGLTTTHTIPISDYTQHPATVVDYCTVYDFQIVRVRGRIDPALALEKHRFDVRLGVWYTITTLNG